MSTKVAFGALGIACVMAAGGGAYLASRQNASDLAVPTPISSSVQADTAARPAPSVSETEAVIDEAAKAKPSAVAEAPESKIPEIPAASERPAPRPARPAARQPRRTAPPAVPTAQAPAPAVTTPVSGPAAESTRPGAQPVQPAAPAEDPATRAIDPSPAPVEQASPSPAREPQRTFEELVVSPDSVIGLEIETTVTSERARIEDRVEARVTRDVKVGDRVAIPAGSRMLGSVTQVERGGKVRERARLGVRFHTLVLADGARVPVSSDTLYREGDAPAKESAAKIGGAAVGGAILGAILGGGKGAAAGAAAGAAGGTAAVMAGQRNPATLAAGSTVTVRMLSPVTITIEKFDEK